ncbi:hypothetical protein J3R83DRAFT_334 [Lanmaoa asiatica]|nr:hypothetical protein J3R83DRAFT_334 [Lanmaoa asiatica]
MNKSRFSQFNEDAYRLPEGMRRIAYDADTQRYTFRDRSGQLYQSTPGEEYELPDPALRQWSQKPAKTFGDILPLDYITAAQSGIESPTSIISSSEKLVQAAMPKVQGVVEIVRRRTTMRRPAGSVRRSDSLTDEKRRLLEDDSWEVVRKDEVTGSRIARSKSEMRPSRYYSRK